MENKNNNGYVILWLMICLLSGFVWLLLLLLKVFGIIMWGWASTLLSLFWLPLLLGVAIFGSARLLLAISNTKANAKLRKRQKQRDQRVIAQAKAIGAWDKRPTPLGGRALELKAWEDFKIKREPGETDKELRGRCMAAADEELATAERW